MRRKSSALFLLLAIFGASLIGCNFPTSGSGAGETEAAATLGSLEMNAALTLTAGAPAPSNTPLPPATVPLPSSVTAAGILVINDTLCWVGPGSLYEVVSAVHKGTRPDLLGRGTISGWFIVRNPIYRDPCWIQASDVQVDPGLNLSALPYFSPPPTPTPTPTNTPTITPSPTP